MWYQYKYWNKPKTSDGTLALYIAALSPFSEYIFMKTQRLGGLCLEFPFILVTVLGD